MTETKPKYTFADLKRDLDKLSPEQLAYPVRWWGDERGGHIEQLLILEEDFVSLDGGMAEPIGTYLKPNGTLTEDAKDCDLTLEDLGQEARVAFKGQPILASEW